MGAQAKAGSDVNKGQERGGSGEPWGIAVLLMLIGILNILDRILPGFLAELIKRDLSLSDAALGFINGFGFLVVYAVAGIPIARRCARTRDGVSCGHSPSRADNSSASAQPMATPSPWTSWPE